ncbi:MAG: DUF92 domain-containing protein [Deltaproteobacteria bacterium]|jgi:uncharacterized protein (TIGR00297 family)|nr:DUF92 domain-containing protein [Deltaproteobacteria bacterium]MBW2530439.1 DUF92 domain-containing protein [Deltaproteobacteria bacterium]
MNDTTTALYALGLLLGLVGLGEVMRRVLRWPAEISRKVIHAGTALLVVLATLSFESAAIPILLALPFVLINIVAIPRRWIPSMHAIERRSWGTVTFPLAFITLATTCWLWAPERVIGLQVAFVVMGLADPAAAIAGERLGRLTYDLGGGNKSWVGTVTFALVAWLGTFTALTVLADMHLQERLVLASLVALTTTVAEMLGGRGWDNLVIALVSAAIVVIWIEAPMHRERMLLAVGFCALAAVLSLLAGFLQRSGAAAAGLLGFVLLGLGGVTWLVPALVFFVLASVLSKLGRRRKAEARTLADKGSHRDAGQVYANGGVGGWLAVLGVLWPSPLWHWAFLGSVAAAAADTWGTEIGTFARGATRHVLSGRPVPPGMSGGVSLWGSIGSLLGALTIGATVLAFEPAPEAAAVSVGLVTAAGLLGALGDSVAGASVQALYEHPVTKRPTERARSEAGEHRLVRGYRFIDNDRVNLLCTLVGALAALALFWSPAGG